MSEPAIPDSELAVRCLRGDEEAWSVLLDRYRRLMYSVPVRFGLSEPDADEVFQRTCVSLLRSLRNLRDVDRLAGWISVTAANHARMLLRERKGKTELTGETAAGGPDVPGLLRRLEDAEILRAGLGMLDSRCRALLDLLFFSPVRRSYEEISSRLDLPVGSIGPTRGRCLEKLRAHLSEMGLGE